MSSCKIWDFRCQKCLLGVYSFGTGLLLHLVLCGVSGPPWDHMLLRIGEQERTKKWAL